MKKVLLVDDDEVICRIYQSNLALQGYAVEVARDGDQAVKLLEKVLPDLVLLDLILPKRNGVELLKIIRAHPKLHAIPVVIFSNTYLSNMVQEAWKNGATKCLSKLNASPKEIARLVLGLLDPAASVPAPSEQEPVALSAPVRATPPAENDPIGQVRGRLIAEGPHRMTEIRKVFQEFLRSHDPQVRGTHLRELADKLHSLVNAAGICGVFNTANFCGAFEALVRELVESPTLITASTARTIAQGVDFLEKSWAKFFDPAFNQLTSPLVLAVDDDPVSREAVSLALTKAKVRAIRLGDPETVLHLVRENQFDLVVMDVGLPGMNGFELCAKIRECPNHRSTPVLFVTGMNDFETRTRSTLSGGTDLIAKPFLCAELALKTLMALQRRPRSSTETPEP